MPISATLAFDTPLPYICRDAEQLGVCRLETTADELIDGGVDGPPIWSSNSVERVGQLSIDLIIRLALAPYSVLSGTSRPLCLFIVHLSVQNDELMGQQ